MKIGLITEGIKDGADQKVYEYFINKLRPDVQILARPLGNKKDLSADCGETASLLIAEGCERVMIIWDLHPNWRDTVPCRHEDKVEILGSLNEAKVDLSKTALVCIEEELEALLLADGRGLSDFLSTPIRPVKIPDNKNPERINNPKKRLTQILKEHGKGMLYTDRIHAIRILEKLPDLKRMMKLAAFKRFAAKVTE